MLQFHNADRPASLTSREELTRFLTTKRNATERLTVDAIRKLSAPDKDAYDRERFMHLSGGIVISTPHLQTTKKLLTKAFVQNMGRNSGHHGVMLSGDSTLGKTTIAKSLMQYVHSQYNRQFPDYAQHGKLPVVFVEVPVASTPKLLMRNFADFLGLSVRTGESARDIQVRVVQALKQAGTQLVVIDELHNLLGSRDGNTQTVDALKSLHNDLPATFLYAGIDIAQNGLLNGTARGAQLSGRFHVLELSRLDIDIAEQADAWEELIDAFEAGLPLANHGAGTLRKLSPYLHERTGGSIGSLGRLITGAAVDAITDGNPADERITKARLDAQLLDHAAESGRLDRKRSQARRRTANLIPRKKKAS
ncbi:MAG: TniB family NTP-binding protein [Rhodococcus sp. (in: high G+C Gram-positive bacteria)]